MGNLIKKFKNKFTQIPNTIINDPRLSLRAKGLYMHLLSKPDGWKYYVSEFIKSSKDGRDSVQSGIKELEEYGYLVRIRAKDNYGQFLSYDYYIYDEPLNGFPVGWETPQTEKALNGKPPSTNNKPNNTDFTNTDCRCETRAEFKKYIRTNLINEDILTSKDKNTNQTYIISVDPEGRLYDKKGARFNSNRSLEIWDALFKYYSRHQLDFQKSKYIPDIEIKRF